MPRYTYVGISVLKTRIGISVTTHDADLLRVVEAASRAVDEYCGRWFYAITQTRYLNGGHAWRAPYTAFLGNSEIPRLRLPADLVAITSLKEDEDGDATYETTWASTDYELGPYDGPYAADPTSGNPDQARPYRWMEPNQRSNGTKSSFGTSQKRFELAGVWGWSRSTKASGTTAAEAIDASETAIDVADGTAFSAGETIMIDSEQMYITSIATNTLTVERGANGTTAATHDTGVAISIIQYPSAVREAVIIEAGLAWETKGYRRQVSLPEAGIVTPFGRPFSLETRTHLDPYRLLDT